MNSEARTTHPGYLIDGCERNRFYVEYFNDFADLRSVISFCYVSLRSLTQLQASMFVFRPLCVHCFRPFPRVSSADAPGARLAHTHMYGQFCKLRNMEVTWNPVLSALCSFHQP